MEELRPYQLRAVQEVVKAIEASEDGRFLTLDLGFGKTRVMLEALKQSGKKAIVFAPLLVAQQTWPGEIYKWQTGFTYRVCHGNTKRSAVESDVDIILVPYSSIKWVYKYGKEHGGGFFRGRTVIYDESTAFKRTDTKRFGMLKAMLPLCRNGTFCLSGRPAPEGYHGLWSQYYVLDCGRALGRNITEYRNRYFSYDANRFKYNLLAGADKLIEAAIAPITIALNTDEQIQLPEVFKQTLRIPMDTNTKEVYAEMAKESVTRIVEYCETGDLIDEIRADNAGAKLNKLRQIAQGFIYGYQPWELNTTKAEFLKELVEAANDDPVLCAIYFKHEVEMLNKCFERELPIIAGGVSASDKKRLLDSWDKGEIPLLLVHPASLSHGVNMQYGGHILVWYSLPWSFEQYAQLNARLIRPGQSKPVRIYHLCTKGTVDSYVACVLELKHATAEDFRAAMLKATQEYMQLDSTSPSETEPGSDSELL